jgi:putative phosphoserine phosphatase/1-acylglycerol-3-phosphate O-acyltransferase
MWARSNVVRPGTVQVRVLPPVSTRGWSAEELDARVAEVRQMFVETLATWPLLNPGRPGPSKND